jgi:hypothetical protein
MAGVDLKFTVEWDEDNPGFVIKLNGRQIHYEPRFYDQPMTEEELEQAAADWFERRLAERNITL